MLFFSLLGEVLGSQIYQTNQWGLCCIWSIHMWRVKSAERNPWFKALNVIGQRVSEQVTIKWNIYNIYTLHIYIYMIYIIYVYTCINTSFDRFASGYCHPFRSLMSGLEAVLPEQNNPCFQSTWSPQKSASIQGIQCITAGFSSNQTWSITWLLHILTRSRCNNQQLPNPFTFLRSNFWQQNPIKSTCFHG